MEIPTAPEVARRIADALEEAGVPYAIGGAIAYSLYAPPRATNDVDVNIFLEPDELAPALDALEEAGADFERSSVLESAVRRGDFIVHLEGMRVDAFVLSIPLSAAAAERVREAELLGRAITILSPEDLVLFKLLFFRRKDRDDVARVVAFQGDALDRGYVRRWLVDLIGADDPRVEYWDDLLASEEDRSG